MATAPQPLTADDGKRWITEEEIAQLPELCMEPLTWKVLNIVRDKKKKNEGVYPCEVLECVTSEMERRGESVNTEVRPQFLRAKSLEDQMLSIAGYGSDGKL